MGAINDIWHAIFSDPTTTVAIAFIIFMGFAGPKIWKAMTAGLDSRADKIKAELDEATRLREEAQKLLADYKRKQRDAEEEAEAIIAHAREEAERVRAQAEKDLGEALARRERQAEERIAQAEAQALADVRNTAVSAAIAATAKLLTDKLDDQGQGKLIDQAISALDGKLH